MRKVLNLLFTLAMCISLNACSSKQQAEPAEAETGQAVEVDEGLIDVTVTLPESFFELMDTTNEEYVESQEENSTFKEVKLNDDGSVDITMSKKDYKTMMNGLAESIDTSLQDLVDDNEHYPNIIGIKVNDDYSKFTVTLDSGQLSMNDSLVVLAFYYAGGTYQMFDGKKTPHIDVEFVDKDGTVIETADSDSFFNQDK